MEEDTITNNDWTRRQSGMFEVHCDNGGVDLMWYESARHFETPSRETGFVNSLDPSLTAVFIKDDTLSSSWVEFRTSPYVN